MKQWLKRIRAAVVMGVIWAVAWAVVGGAVMEGILDPHGRIIDMWPQTLGIAGLLGGAVFSTVLGVAARRRSFEELSLVAFGALGAAAGVAVGVVVLTQVVSIAVMAVLCGLSAAGSLALARKGQQRALPNAGDPAELP